MLKKHIYKTGLVSTILMLVWSCESAVSTPSKPIVMDERWEFNELMKKDSIDKNQRAAEAVNQFINDSITSTNAALLVKNNSECNIIFRISGATNYNLPVPKKSLNYLVLKKGNYQFKSKLCNAIYSKNRTLTESIEVSLSEN